MSDLLDNRPRQITGYELPSGPTIQDWLLTLYPQAQAEAERMIRGRKNWEDEYCLSGRFSNPSRNIPRTLQSIEEIFLDRQTFFKNKHQHMNDFVDLLLPITCYHMLVGEIISAAGAEYYYKYEKSYE